MRVVRMSGILGAPQTAAVTQAGQSPYRRVSDKREPGIGLFMHARYCFADFGAALLGLLPPLFRPFSPLWWRGDAAAQQTTRSHPRMTRPMTAQRRRISHAARPCGAGPEFGSADPIRRCALAAPLSTQTQPVRSNHHNWIVLTSKHEQYGQAALVRCRYAAAACLCERTRAESRYQCACK